MQTTLYKRAVTNKIYYWTIEKNEDLSAYRTIIGYMGGALTVSEWTFVQEKNIGKTNQTSLNDQLDKEIMSLIQKKKDKGYVLSIKDVDSVNLFHPMLAYNLADYEIEYPVIVQPKLDGIRCIASANGLYSRNNKPFMSSPHVFRELKSFFEKFPNIVLDGEFYNDAYSDNFNKIVSLVRKTKPTAADLLVSERNIQYHVYDIYDEANPDLTQRSRLQWLTNVFGAIKFNSIKVVPSIEVVTSNDLDNHYADCLEKGYEGQMIRNPFAPYENKRSKYLLKNKEFKDDEFEIVDICEGVGNRAKTAGYAVLKLPNGQTFKSNFKGSFAYMTKILNTKRQLIGKKAKVKFFNYTPDGIPRFPHIIEIDREKYE